MEQNRKFPEIFPNIPLWVFKKLQIQYNDRRYPFQQMVLKQLNNHRQKEKNLNLNLSLCTEIYSKGIIHWNVWCKTTKLLGKKTRKSSIWLGKEFLTLKAKFIKEKLDKFDLIKIKKFCGVKTVEKNKRTSYILTENICKPQIHQRASS